MSFPPRKESIGANMTKAINSPLPALPDTNPGTGLPKQMNAIPRKALAPPTSQPAPQQEATPLKLKRMSSISSLLSAYSRTSSDSVHRSSGGSFGTKDSEVSFSPERDGTKDAGRDFIQTLETYSGNPHDQSLEYQTNEVDDEALAPPPPLKDVATPRTPRSGLPATPRSSRPVDSPAPAADTAPSGSFTNSSPSPPRPELWRRRASSKSDGSLAVTGLKLAISHGSTAATTRPSEPLNILPSNNYVQSNSNPHHKYPNALPGRNVRPAPTGDDGADMKKLAQSFKALTRKGADDGGVPSDQQKPKTQTALKEALEIAPAPPHKGPPTPDRSPDELPSSDGTKLPTRVLSPLSSPDSGAQKPDLPIRRRPLAGPSEAQIKLKQQKSLTSPTASAHTGLRQTPSKESLPGTSTSRSLNRNPPADLSPRSLSDSQQKELPQAPSLSISISDSLSPGARTQPVEASPRLGLPSGPRPTKSNKDLPKLRSDPRYFQDAQRVPSAMRSADSLRTAANQSRNPVETPTKSPTEPPAPPKKEQLFELVNGLNTESAEEKAKREPRFQVPTKAPTGANLQVYNRLGVDIEKPTEALGEVSEEPDLDVTENQAESLTDEEQASAMAAISRFPRNWISAPTGDIVHPAKDLTVTHYQCLQSHQRWLRVKNINYPVACMTCGVADRNWRAVCKGCQVRVCYKCSDLLRETKDLATMQGTVQEADFSSETAPRQMEQPASAIVA